MPLSGPRSTLGLIIADKGLKLDSIKVAGGIARIRQISHDQVRQDAVLPFLSFWERYLSRFFVVWFGCQSIPN